MQEPLSEHRIQSAFFQWVRVMEKTHPCLELMFAVPNAGKRSYKIAAMLKAEGMRTGVLDIIFPVARAGFNGLAIEFKKPNDGRLTEEQEKFAHALADEGWLVVTITDSDRAITLVKNYLGIKNG